MLFQRSTNSCCIVVSSYTETCCLLLLRFSSRVPCNRLLSLFFSLCSSKEEERGAEATPLQPQAPVRVAFSVGRGSRSMCGYATTSICTGRVQLGEGRVQCVGSRTTLSIVTRPQASVRVAFSVWGRVQCDLKHRYASRVSVTFGGSTATRVTRVYDYRHHSAVRQHSVRMAYMR